MITIMTSKMILIRMSFPMVICYFQFGIAALVSNLFMAAKGIKSLDLTLLEYSTNMNSKSNLSNTASGKSLSRPQKLVWQIAATFTLGFLVTNWAFSLSSVGFAETIKSGEPVFVVLLNSLLYGTFPSSTILVSLFVIVIGVATSVCGDYNFVFLAFILAVLSNVFFGLRAVLTKQLFMDPSRIFPDTDSYRGIKLFAKVSELGAVAMIPIATFVEGWSLYQEVLGPTPISTDDLLFLMVLVVCNGLFYACYNLMSFIVLTNTDVVTHAALNIMRRVVIIVFTSIVFSVVLTWTNYIGVLIAVCGAMAYSKAKLKQTKKDRE